MKITKPVSVETDVEIEITKEDIAECLADLHSWSGDQWLMSCYNSVAQFLKAVPNESIVAMTPHQRDCIRVFLKEQSERFASASPAEQSELSTSTFKEE